MRLVRLSKRSARVQSLVEHNDPLQVALEVGKGTRKICEQDYESFQKMRDSSAWKKAIQAFDQQYLSGFATGEQRRAVAPIRAAYLSNNKVRTTAVKESLEAVKTAISNLDSDICGRLII